MAKTKKKAAPVEAERPRPKRSIKPRKPAPAAGSRGLTPSETAQGQAPESVAQLMRQIAKDGGAVLGAYRDPLGGRWQVLATLPIEMVDPTPYQRDLSVAHVARLASRIERVGRYLDPIIVYRASDEEYWAPNGHHRLAAMRRLGARAISALVMPEEEIAFKILALNTEKAHNLREKSLEAIRMARALATHDPKDEQDYSLEFEEPSFLTLGACYEHNGKFSGVVYQPVLKRVDKFLDESLPAALKKRATRAKQLIDLDDAVSAIVAKLQQRGFDSPYLKAFVIASITPRPDEKSKSNEFDATIALMRKAATKFDASKIKAEQIARAGGPTDEG
ncbi:MAG: ParB N-terminal domain-containing protein [Acidobacteriota bacterium]